MSRQSFDRLASKIYSTYRSEGYSPERAMYIADAAAGKVAREKRAKSVTKGRRRRRRTTRVRH